LRPYNFLGRFVLLDALQLGELKRQALGFLSTKHPALFARLDLRIFFLGQQRFQPQLNIAACKSHPLPLRTERHRMPADFAEPERLYQATVRELPYSDGLAKASAGDEFAVWTECHRGDIVDVAGQGSELAGGADVPDSHHLIFAAGGD